MMKKNLEKKAFNEKKDGNINNSNNSNNSNSNNGSNNNNTDNTDVHSNSNGNETGNARKKYGFMAESARAIQDADYDVKDFIIDGLITPGLNILAGPKKHGKSMLALNMALSIAGEGDFWDRKTEHGKVLYMSLEDNKKRTKDRINKMLDYADAPEPLKLAYAVDIKGPCLSKGIEAFLQDNPDTKAVIIDVLEKVRTPKSSSQSDYSHDYNEIGAFQKTANQYGIAMIVVTHCRKTRDSDWINEISGGVGVTGAADTILRLKKMEGDAPEGNLFIIGRDVPEERLAVSLDDKTLRWSCIGASDELELKKAMEMYHASPVVKAIKILLEKNHGRWSGTSRELLDLGLKELGEPIAKNESALARKINALDGLFQNDSIIHTRPDPNGGVAGRIHHFTYKGPAQQPLGQDGPSKVISMGLEQEARPGQAELPF